MSTIAVTNLKHESSVTDNISLTSGGNVGIGTSSPSTKLTIQAASDHLRLQGTANTNKNVSIFYTESGDYGQINCDESGVNQKDLWITGLNLKFGRNTSLEHMRIDSSGNVGIGTSSPAYKLDVIQDANSFAGARIRNNDSGSSAYAGLILNGYGNSWGLRMGSSAANSNALQFVLDALGTPSVKASIDSSGNVGIGTDSPNYALHIKRPSGTDTSVNLEQTGVYSWEMGMPASGAALLFKGGGTELLRILSSGGITFNGDTAAANALDDYEEGTWTPVLTSSGTPPTFTYTAGPTGTYTKIGNTVTVVCFIRANITNAGTGTPRVTGLPFAGLFGAGPYLSIRNAFTNQSVNASYLNGTQIEIDQSTYAIIQGYVDFSFTYIIA